MSVLKKFQRQIGLLLIAATLAACGPEGETDTTPPPPPPPVNAGTVGFAAAAYTVAQNATSVTLVVNRTGGAGGAISVSYVTVNATAVGGTEFAATSGNLSWADGDATAKTIQVSLNSMSPFVGSKAFSVALSAATGGSTLAAPASSTVTITGTAPPPAAGTVGFAAATYTVGQNAGSVTLAVNRTGGAGGAISVSYATVNGTAVGGSEFTSTNGTLNWANGDATAKTIQVSISSTAPFSGSKAFSVILSAATGGSTLATPASSTVTITGTAPPPVAGALLFASTTYTVAQSAGSVTLAVNRSGGSSGAISVAYSTANGTAAAGSDYTATTGSVSWANADVAPKTIVVPVNSTNLFTGSKTFTVTLSAPTGGGTLSTPSSSTVTITGSAPPVSNGSLMLSAAAYTVAQSAGSLTVTASRTGGSSGAVTVNYSSTNGTATAGTDYTAVGGTLNWASGDTAPKTFAIPISSASPFTGNKTFNITLSAPGGGASLGSPVSAVATISGSGTVGGGGAMGQAAAARLLMQGTFGATLDTINTTAGQSYDAWFAAQAAAASSLSLPAALAVADNVNWKPTWFRNVVQGPDQLRQRMAFALSEILVISNNGGPLWAKNQPMAAYQDLLVTNALGNYRTLLEKVSLSPAMGLWLSSFRNDKSNPAIGTHADENYAREIMQLFAVGLVQLNLDGSVQKDANGIGLPTYSQADVTNLAKVFTGWASKPNNHSGGEQSWQFDDDYVNPMVAYENHHDTTAKTIIGGVQIPAGGTAASDLQAALDTIFNHPNVGPFISEQLIQRLVTSNPSRAYVLRVAQVFNNNGQGVRGDLLAVARAILTDSEAVVAGGDNSGKLREPMLRLTNMWRAMNAIDGNNGFNEYQIISETYRNFVQGPLEAPSVFNFFRPDYQRAGVLTTNGLVAPEFQITNEVSLVNLENTLQRLAYQYTESNGNRHSGPDADNPGNLNASNVMLRTAQWESLAATPATLVDQMNLVFMAGTMPSAMRDTLINYASTIPASSPAARVIETMELLINSPQYAVQR